MRAQFHLYSAVLDDVGCNADLCIANQEVVYIINNLLIKTYRRLDWMPVDILLSIISYVHSSIRY